MSGIDAKVSHVRRETRKGQSRDHECHAKGCTRQVPPALFMCAKHWKMVPKEIQRRVWQAYQVGQERGDVLPTREYIAVQREAVEAVEKAESRQGRLSL